jgi:hypothetical protein
MDPHGSGYTHTTIWRVDTKVKVLDSLSNNLYR